MNSHPATQLLRTMAARYPNAGRLADVLRHEPEQTWPSWCFLPVSGAMAIVTEGRDLDKRPPTILEAADAQLLTATLAWRPGQDIVRFDPEVYKALTDTALDDAIPDSLLYRLPAWCLYIELQEEKDFCGFFAHLEHDMTDHRAEMRMLFLPHDDGTPMPVIMHLGYGSISAGLEAFERESRAQMAKNAQLSWLFHGLDQDLRSDMAAAIQLTALSALSQKALSLVLYLCSADPEIAPLPDGSTQPSMPVPKKVKGGWRIFPPDRPRIWHVGQETGIKIRAAKAGGHGQHSGPRPHIRRAHWHTFWTGRKKFAEGETPIPQTPQARWLPPIAVAMKEDNEDA